MKKRHSNKKGFTLIELVIVIAVIGILAAVLVPTFTNLIGQANYAADQSTVTNLNRTYATAKADKKITRNNTMYQAVKMVEGSNFKLDAIQHNSSNGNFIAWDSRYDEFVLVNEKNRTYEKNGQTIDIIDQWDFFRVYDSIPDKQDYSIYLSNKSIIREEVNITVGFDAGDNHSVTKLTYDRSSAKSKRAVKIRTNSGTDFTAHGYDSGTDGDEIYHYGEAGEVIVDSAFSSFYENGSSVHTDVQKGHYVQNKGSVVGYLEASAEEGNVNITLKSGSLRGVLKNTNDGERAVSIKGEVDASTINAEIDKTKGEINIKLETQPAYSNVEDGDGFTSGLAKKYSILGIGSHGSKQMQAPSSTGCKEHHNFISVDGSSIKICSECSAYQYTKTSMALNAQSAEETQEKTYICENNGGKYVKINNTQGHEHHFSQEWGWVIDPEDFTKCTGASLTLQCTPKSNDDPDDCDFSVTLPAEITDDGATPDCTKDVTKTFTATVNYYGITYTMTKDVILQHLKHEWSSEVSNPTCTKDGKKIDTCSHCGEKREETIPATGHADTDGDGLCNACGASMLAVNLPYTNEFLYKVGNQGAVSQSLLFKNIPASFDPDIETVTGAATGSYDNGSFKFENTGVVQITCGDVVLDLEVVDAVNAVSLEDIGGAILSTNNEKTTQNNIVLLKDISRLSGANSVVINNGYTLYGNGFKMTCTGNGGRNDSVGLGEGYIQVADGGQLDNVVIIAPDFPKGYLYSGDNLYDYYVKEGENKIDDNNHFAYQLSAVRTSGVATITNSYIYGARNNVLAEGTLSLDNCVLTNGSLSNLHFSSSNGVLNLKDLTTIQYKRTANDLKGNEKTILGLGIIIGPRPDANVDISSNPTINISGYFKQYNWVCKQDGNDVTSSKIASRFVSAALSNPEFVTKVNGIDYTDLGIIYLNGANRTINDSRVNHGGYVGKTISISGVSGYAYAPAANSQEVEILDSQYIYKPSRQDDSLPFLEYSDVSDDGSKAFKRNAAFDYEFTVKLDEIGSYVFDFEKLSAILMGEKAEYTVKDSSNNVINGSVQINSAGTNKFNIVINSNKSFDKNGNKSEGKERTYTFSLALVGNLTELPKPSEISEPVGTCVKITQDSGFYADDEWTMAAAPLDGLIIKYWSTAQNKEIEKNFSNITVSGVTSNSITIEESDYTLELTSTPLHSSSGVSNTWVTVDGKLYVTTTQRVKAGTTSRATTITYIFSDSRKNQLTITKAFATNAPAADEILYYHDDFLNGIATSGKAQEGTSCFASGTLITLADGSQKAIENITQQDKILAWDFNKGCYVASDIFCVTNHGENEYKIAHLAFSDGSNIEIISKHGMFDATTNRFENITTSNASDFVGHEFIMRGANDEIIKVLLKDVEIVNKVTSAYSIISVNYLNIMANEYWTLDPSIYFLVPFEINNEYMFDAKAIENDIETYGLMEYAECEQYAPFMTEGQFNAVSGKYVKIAIGKGIITMDEIVAFAQEILIDQQYIVE